MKRARKLGMVLHGALALASISVVVVACSSADDDVRGAGVVLAPEGGAVQAPEDAGKGVDSPDAGEAGLPDGTCEGACRTTQAAVSFGGKEAPLDRGQFGVEASDASAPLYYAEMHFGGDPACPSQGSPSPDRTFVLAHIPRGTPGQVFTEQDGLAGSFLDFKGDLVQKPITKATSIHLVFLGVDAATKPGWLAYEVQAQFAEGALKGHFYATHCDSLDD